MGTIFETLEKFKQPSTILWRGIELKLVKERLDKILTEEMVMLDLGCGEGIVAGAIFNRQVDIGLDNELGMVEMARESGVYKQVILGDATKMTVKDRSIDLVFSNSVVEHIKDIDSVLAETKRVLKKGGLVVLTLPSDNLSNYGLFSRLHLSRLAVWYGKKRNQKFNHFNCHSIGEWRKKLEEKGLKLIDSHSYMSKQEAEDWDILLISFYLLDRLSSKFSNWIYFKIRGSILERIKNARMVTANGAAICIIARA